MMQAGSPSVEEGGRASNVDPTSLLALRRRLERAELIADRAFDTIYPDDVRRASSVHWTPVEVAMRIMELLELERNATLLDIGAGVGKFCIVARAVARHVHVRGVEHRPRFVEIANRAAATVGVDVDVRLGGLRDVDPKSVDALYLFNPFAENLADWPDQLDASVELGRDRYRRDVRAMEQLLARARNGTRLVTYCGWGGVVPDDYHLIRRESCAGRIEIWRKSGR